jgi:U3 small nucleolar RNA-associated protein 22
LPSVPAQHPLAAAKSLSKKGISTPYPLPQPTEDTNWTVSFEKPSDITVVGSWGNKISVKGKDGQKFGVDVAVEMPEVGGPSISLKIRDDLFFDSEQDLFQEKDYLNGRFFHKKAFYLATIAAAVISPKSGLKMDAFYDSAQDDPRLTVLVLRPQNGIPYIKRLFLYIYSLTHFR